MNDNTARLFFHLMTDDGAPRMLMPQPKQALKRLFETYNSVVDVIGKHTEIFNSIKILYVFDDPDLSGMLLNYGNVGDVLCVSRDVALGDKAELIDTILHEISHTVALYHGAEFHMVYSDLLRYWNKETGDVLTDWYMHDITRWDSIAKRK